MEKLILSEKIRNLADSIGIDTIGFAEASEFSDYRLSQHQRRDPKLTMPDANSIIIAGLYIEAAEVIELYKSLGFEQARKTVPMWIYAGTEH